MSKEKRGIDRRSFIMGTGAFAAAAAVSAGALGCAQQATPAEGADDVPSSDVVVDSNAVVSNVNTVAVAWKGTAAEHAALFHQGFNLAKERVAAALENHSDTDKPLAVISDMDDTLVNPIYFWNQMIERDIEFFDDALWDQLIAEYTLVAMPGAVEFATYVQENNVELFYISSRNQEDDQEKTDEYAITQLEMLGFPYADEDHVTILMDSSNKEEIQNEIAENYQVIVKLGDNLNDFNRSFYVEGVQERKDLATSQKELFGTEYIIFPNPTDGHWVRAIFGESEPPDTAENRQLLRDAAEGKVE